MTIPVNHFLALLPRIRQSFYDETDSPEQQFRRCRPHRPRALLFKRARSCSRKTGTRLTLRVW